MANEFVARNGLISQNNTIVSGSLTVTQNITGSNLLLNGSTGTLFSANIDTLILTGSINVTAGITGSLLGTGSWATNALTASYIATAQTASYVTGSIFTSTNRVLSASNALTASRVVLSNGLANSVQYGGGSGGILMTGSGNFQYNGLNMTLTNGYILQSNGTNYYLYLGKTGLVGADETGIWSYDTALDNTYPITSYDISTNKYYFANYNIVYNGANAYLGVGTSTPAAKLHVLGSSIITSALTVGSSSLGPSENTLTLGAQDAINEGGQLGFNAPGGTYISASFIDLYQNRLRILKGTNAGTNAEIAWWSMHTKQMALPAYNSLSAFTGSSVAKLAVDSSGNVLTVANGFDSKLDLYAGLGSTTKAESPFYSTTTVNGTASTTNFQFNIQAIPIPSTATITGVKWYQGTNGVYTSTAGTSVALYTYSAGTITLVASSSNQSIFSSSYGSATTWRTASFTSTYTATPGIYYIGFCWNPSATTTAPTLGTSPQISLAVGSTYDYTNSAAVAMVRNSLGTCPSSQALSGMSAAVQTLYYLALY